MSEEKLTIDGFGDVEMDAIGEIMNITMGSAATAVSNMLSAKVWITTPQVRVIRSEELSFPELEPSIMVKIKYIQGVSGQNVLVLKQNDVQLILDQLMGLPLEVTEDFQFDEMNISAVCEVMNQMMGASATALSEIIETTVDISTPEAMIQEGGADAVKSEIYDVTGQEYVCVVKFNLTIDGVIESEFISVLTIDLAKEMADKMMAGYNNIMDDIDEPVPAPAPAPAAAPAGGTMTQDQIEAMMGGGAAAPQAAQTQQMPQQPMQQQPMMGGMPGQPAMGGMPMGTMPQQPMMGAMPQQGMPMQMPYGQPMDPNMAAMYGYPQQGMYPQPAVNIQPIQLQNFAAYQNASLNQEQNDNLKLLMNVPLNVTVEIGSTVKKVKEILDFTQGTIIELERQAGAPVDIIVNGNLVAKGDVVVIDDNFAVRVTEIIKSKFLEALTGS